MDNFGIKYPKTYLDAFGVLNCENWYPDTIFDGYDRVETWYYQNSNGNIIFKNTYYIFFFTGCYVIYYFIFCVLFIVFWKT